MAFQGCDLPEPFRFRIGFGLEKLPAFVKWTEIEIPGMGFAVAIFKDSETWSFHGREYTVKRLKNVNIKSTNGLDRPENVAIRIGNRLGSSVGRAVD